MSPPLLQPLPSAANPLPPGSTPAARQLKIVPFPLPADPYPPPPRRVTFLPDWPEPAPASESPSAWPGLFPTRGGIGRPPVANPSPADGTEIPPPLHSGPPVPEFTDEDLRNALAPLVAGVVETATCRTRTEFDPSLEPLLRATLRRTLAEYSPSSRPFHPPRALDRFRWRLNALFTSRSYEEVLFEKTHRFRIDEVFILDSTTLALVSHASCDPARHASIKRVQTAIQRLALRLRDENGQLQPSLPLGDHRIAINRQGRQVILVAIVRGKPNDILLTDLDFALLRIETHFRDRFNAHGSPLVHALQPFLEDCLLIQAPATAA